MGVAGFEVTRRLAASPEPGPDRPESLVPRGPDAEVLALRNSVKTLSHENQDLAIRLAALELSPQGSQRIQGEGILEVARFEAFEAEVREWMGRSKTEQAENAPHQISADVRLAMDVIQAERAAEGERIREQKIAAALERSVQHWQQALQLDQHQTAAMRQALEANQQRNAELTTAWKSGNPEGLDLEAVKADNQTTFRTELQGFLTGEQYNTFTESKAPR